MTPRALLLSLVPCLSLALAAGAREPADGEVRIVGSGSTVMPIVELWKARFALEHPQVSIDASGEGTTWGAAALMSGRAHIAAMSREMTDGEIEVFRRKVGSKPAAFPISTLR